jgi:large subunit ribosomal protein L25
MAVLKASKRGELGTRKVKSLRVKGEIPGIIYGHGEATVPVTLTRHDVDVVLKHGDRLLELDVDGQTQNVLIKDVQYDHLGVKILHVDLARVSLDERVEVVVPVVLRGTPAGASEGGVLTQVLSQAKIECLVTAIPDDLRVSVAEMKVGDVMNLGKVPLPEGAKLLDNPETIICTVSVITEAEVAPAEGEVAVAEPEVIGAKEEEGAEGEAAEGEEKPKKEKEKEKE